MTREELKKLKKSMPRGYRDTLSEEFNVTTGYIDQILRGDKTRPDIIDRAIEIAAIYKRYLADQKAKIKKL
ncbi:MAG: hypothetical protein JNL03_01090 [Prolixibacteraceae bacterium]|nr:hypothetical protein [Prolixibacteraceae bacterium]